jgi:hypothetical protein
VNAQASVRDFLRLVKAAVASRDVHGLVFVDTSESPWRTTAFFRNSTTGVEFQWEDSMHVLFGRLSGGRIPARPYDITESTRSDAHYLEFLLEVRAPRIELPLLSVLDRQHPEDFQNGLLETVDAMEQFAGDVLTGDFTVFRELDRLVWKREVARRAGSAS